MARRGQNNITVRMDPDLWERFGEITPDRSELIRQFVRYYVGELARPPRRPARSS